MWMTLEKTDLLLLRSMSVAWHSQNLLCDEFKELIPAQVATQNCASLQGVVLHLPDHCRAAASAVYTLVLHPF